MAAAAPIDGECTHRPSSGDGDDGSDGEDGDGDDGGGGEYGLDDAKAGDDDDADMGAEEHDGDDVGGRRRRARQAAERTRQSQDDTDIAGGGAARREGGASTSVTRWGNGKWTGEGGGGGTETRKADEASERHESTSDGDQREQTTGQRVVGAGRGGWKHTQTPTTAAGRQPDGKKGRLKIDLGPSLADASEGADRPSGERVRLERRSRGGGNHTMSG